MVRRGQRLPADAVATALMCCTITTVCLMCGAVALTGVVDIAGHPGAMPLPPVWLLKALSCAPLLAVLLTGRRAVVHDELRFMILVGSFAVPMLAAGYFRAWWTLPVAAVTLLSLAAMWVAERRRPALGAPAGRAR